MEKEFVPYELSLELKQLGFDEPCFAYYDDGIFTFWYHSEQQPDLVLNCTAPTYSQAFRWFREKCGLNYIIKEVGQVRFEARVYKGDGWATWDFGYKFNTYEEAELACLQKLIEIVKTK